MPIPYHINIIFLLTVLLTIWFMYTGSGRSRYVLYILSAWVVLQSVMAINGFYARVDFMPPRLLLAVLPALLGIVLLFATAKGRRLLDGLDAATLCMLHIVRIPVELVLFALCWFKAVPELMTFEGRNFDILSGLSAPLIWYFGYRKQRFSNTYILVWHFVCLGLLLNIVINAVLSAPFPFQRFAFDQPNIAVLHYPFVLLPSLIVPLVLLAHLSEIRRLIKAGKT